MASLSSSIAEYTRQLRNGHIQKAYKGIMAFMSALKSDMESRYPGYAASALYFGYMDMTYFAFTPLDLKKRNLKIAVVYLHEENRFEAWLGGGNRKVRDEYIQILKRKDIGDLRLSGAGAGIDSIVEGELVSQPDFDHTDDLMQSVGSKAIAFAESILSILNR